jgi:hypothetical protein
LANEEIPPDFDVTGDDDARQVADAKTWPYLGINADVDPVLEVHFPLHALGIKPCERISAIQVLGKPEPEQIPEGIVPSDSSEDVADQPDATSGFFLVRDF